jgi:ferritin-like metal-binding protein YciE
MKNVITPLSLLVDQLNSLYYAEKNVNQHFGQGIFEFQTLRDTGKTDAYLHNTENTILKLERIFNYLMQEPLPGKNHVVDEFVKEFKSIAEMTGPYVHDLLLLKLFQNICDYKLINYKTAYLFAMITELDTVSDLLQQILEDEQESKNWLDEIALSEFTHLPIHH